MGPWGVMTETSVIRIHHNFLSLASSTSLEILNPVHSFMLSVQELSIFLLHSTVCWWITLERVSSKYMCDWECACVIEGAHVWQSTCVIESAHVYLRVHVWLSVHVWLRAHVWLRTYMCDWEYICVIESSYVWLRVYMCGWECTLFVCRCVHKSMQQLSFNIFIYSAFILCILLHEYYTMYYIIIIWKMGGWEGQMYERSVSPTCDPLKKVCQLVCIIKPSSQSLLYSSKKKS